MTVVAATDNTQTQEPVSRCAVLFWCMYVCMYVSMCVGWEWGGTHHRRKRIDCMYVLST
jgi:hypothetical protein